MNTTPPFRGPAMVRGALFSALVLVAGCAADTTQPLEQALEAPVTAAALVSEAPKSADAFVNSIGVNTKLSYLQSTYGNFDGLVKPKLVALGIRHVRDEGITVKSDGWMNQFYGRMRALSANGIKFNLAMRPAEGAPDYKQIYSWDRFLRWALPVIEHLEGLNEWDYKCRCTDWAAKTRDFQMALFKKAKGDTRTKNLPVFAPSMGNPNNASYIGDMRYYLNYGNIHPYPGGGQPMANVSYHTARADAISVDRPWVVTESGYHNAMQWFGGHPPVSERAAARYIPRMYLEYFAAGVRRSYVTELLDEAASTTDRELNFGLVRTNGSVKPAYTALQNMIHVLKDPGASFSTTALSYSLGGDQTNLKRLLMQKRNTVYYLALWQGVSSYDLVSRKDITVGSRNVSVSFPAAVTSVRLFDPLQSGSALKSWSRPTSVTVAVPDYPVIVEITR